MIDEGEGLDGEPVGGPQSFFWIAYGKQARCLGIFFCLNAGHLGHTFISMQVVAHRFAASLSTGTSI